MVERAIESVMLLIIMVLLQIPVLVFQWFGMSPELAGNTLLAIFFWWAFVYCLKLYVKAIIRIGEIVYYNFRAILIKRNTPKAFQTTRPEHS